jgi:hypothetical protein
VKLTLAACPFLAWLAACSSTSLVSEAVGPATSPAPMKRIAVVGVSEDRGQRERFENSFAAAIAGDAKVTAEPATKLVDPERSLDRELLQKALEGGGFDGILVVRKLGTRVEVTKTRPDVPANLDASAYSDFHSQYVDSSFGGARENATRYVRLEVTLLRARDYERLWAGATDSREPSDLEHLAGELAGIVTERLRAHRML